MHVLKSAILSIFQKSANWPDWPYPVSPALQKHPLDLFVTLIFQFLIYYFLSIKEKKKSCEPFWRAALTRANQLISEKLTKWHFLIHAWNLNFLGGQMTSFEAFKNSP